MKKKRPDSGLATAKPNLFMGSKDGFKEVHEWRIFICMMSCALSGQDITKPFQIDAKYILAGKTDGGNNYKHIKDACDTIVGRKINLLPKNGRYFKFRNIVAMADYPLDDSPGKIKVAFNPFLVPLIMDSFKKGSIGYTKMLLKYAMPIRTLYGVWLYEYLLRNRYKSKIVVTINDLKTVVGIEEGAYSAWRDFNRFILIPAQKSIKKYTNIKFMYTPLRCGRKFESIEFCVEDNVPECNSCLEILFDDPPITDANENLPEHVKIVRENIWEKSQKEVLEKYPEKMIEYYYAKLQKTIASGKNLIDSKSYFYTLLKKDSDDYGNIEITEQLAKQKQAAAAEEGKRLEEAAAVEKKRQECLMSLATKYLALLPARDRDKYMFSRKIPNFLPGQLRREAAAELLLRDNGDLFDKNPDEETFLAQYKCMEAK